MLHSPQLGGRPLGVEAHSLIAALAAVHARFKKAPNPAFSEKATREYEPFLRLCSHKLIERIDKAIHTNSKLHRKEKAIVEVCAVVQLHSIRHHWRSEVEQGV